MGVVNYLLDRRTATVHIGSSRHVIGTLRRFFKVTELDEERRTELEAADKITPSPVAAMIADALEFVLASGPKKPVRAHLVLGWDEGMGSVTDFGWDFLPELGYAVRDAAPDEYRLFELRDDRLLYPVDDGRAHELGLLDAQGRLVRRGQPVITECENVRPFLDRYVDADCTFSSGVKKTLLTAIQDRNLPPVEWYLGKKPREVVRYPPERPETPLSGKVSSPRP